jgi:hypothetical protein
MKNKILIKLYVPEIDQTFDLYIPVNELVWKVRKLIVKSVSDLTMGSLLVNDDYVLINKQTADIYKNNEIILDTNIRNATELVLIQKKKM